MGWGQQVLKVTQIRGSDGSQSFQVEGTLAGPWVRELQAACEKAVAEHSPVVLDLLGLTYLDREGASLLLALAREHGALLRNPSPFVREVLGSGTP